MELSGCNPSPECPLWPTCKEDTHHYWHPKAVIRRMGRSAMEFSEAHVQENVCRAQHDEYHATNPINLPTREQITQWRLDNIRQAGL